MAPAWFLTSSTLVLCMPACCGSEVRQHGYDTASAAQHSLASAALLLQPQQAGTLASGQGLQAGPELS
jgi:hypothetical protein